MSNAQGQVVEVAVSPLPAPPRIDVSTRPTTWAAIDAICDAMRADGRDELVHYAGACYRDETAWQVVVAWAADPGADEATLHQRALKATGWD